MHVLLLMQKPVKRELTSGRAECGIVYDVSLLDTLKLLLQNDIKSTMIMILRY